MGKYYSKQDTHIWWCLKKLYYIIFEFLDLYVPNYIKLDYDRCYVMCCILMLKADVNAKDVMAYCHVTDVVVTLVLVVDVNHLVLWGNWLYCDRWKSLWWLMLCHEYIRTDVIILSCIRLIWPCEWWKITCETVNVWSGRWYNHIGWCYCHGRCYCHTGWRSGRCCCHIGRRRQMLLPLWQMLLPYGSLF